MATRTKFIDIVTKIVDGTDINTERSGEELTAALAALAAVQSAAAVTVQPATIDSLIEILVLAASTNIAIYVPFACKLVDAWAYKVGVSADAGDVLAVKNGATDIMTFALNVADGARVSPLATGLDHADNDFAEGDTITIDPTNSTTCACMLFLRVKRTA